MKKVCGCFVVSFFNFVVWFWWVVVKRELDRWLLNLTDLWFWFWEERKRTGVERTGSQQKAPYASGAWRLSHRSLDSKTALDLNHPMCPSFKATKGPL
jgi:hypothetical protein